MAPIYTTDQADPATGYSLWLCPALLALLMLASLYLSLNRIYQVDEAQNLFMARVVGTGQSATFFTNAALWLLGPLAWLSRSATQSAGLFEGARLIMLGVFWLNLVLLTLCTGVRLRSRKGLSILLLAATLAPLWDYGFEIRHDNLILTLLLTTWYFGRVRPRGTASYAVIGFLVVLAQFIAFKSFIYFLPLSLAFLAFPPQGSTRSRIRLGIAWMTGAVVGFLACRLVYGATGQWEVYKAGLQLGLEVSTSSANRLSPISTLARFANQTPLLLGLVAAALTGTAFRLRRREPGTLSWSGPLPECLLFLGALGALLINPTPFPYNLVNLIPFAFLLAVRFTSTFLDDLPGRPTLVLAASGILLGAHLMPFVQSTLRHWDWDNARQERLMSLAEELTDPKKDAVYDAIGMVPTRASIDFHWYLHSLNLQAIRDGRQPSAGRQLAAHPAAVLIASYRTDWLEAADWAFIRTHYLPLADDFWVLGNALAAGGGPFDVIAPGRYLLLGERSGQLGPLQGATLDGHPGAEGVQALAPGRHVLACPETTRPVCVWVGPKLNQIPILPPSDHRNLFVNWY